MTLGSEPIKQKSKGFFMSGIIWSSYGAGASDPIGGVDDEGLSMSVPERTFLFVQNIALNGAGLPTFLKRRGSDASAPEGLHLLERYSK